MKFKEDILPIIIGIGMGILSAIAVVLCCLWFMVK